MVPVDAPLLYFILQTRIYCITSTVYPITLTDCMCLVLDAIDCPLTSVVGDLLLVCILAAFSLSPF